MKHPYLYFALCVACFSFGLLLHEPAQTPVDYETQVLPILKKNCYQCHDAKKQTSSFRLDVREKAFTGGESKKPGIIKYKATESELFRRVVTDDDEEKMPPSSKPRLSPDEVETLKRWINEGATWPDKHSGETKLKHWAFTPPVRPALPSLNSTWPTQPIDTFILAKLEKEKLAPSALANKETLLKRLSLDLIGLPPTLAEMESFLADVSPNAWEMQVDRLLASPHFGERWARVWLDAARYADSDGYEKDKPRPVWFYRDWVIAALNRDLPYDQFIIEQLAGDLLPNATQDQKVATGFLRNSMINEEGGVDPEQFRMEAMFDRMDAIGKGVLGLTIACAQCHDHKFDPISQKEYYGLFAFLNNDHEANIATYTAEEQRKRADLFQKIKLLEDDLKHTVPDWRTKLRQWVKALPNQPKWEVIKPKLDTSGGQKHYLLEDGSILAAGYAPTKHDTDFPVTLTNKKITAFKLELLNDPSLPLSGPGRSIYGLLALTEFKVIVSAIDTPKSTTTLKFQSATADVNPEDQPLEALFYDKTNRKRFTGKVAYAIDGKDETAWGIDIGPGRSNVPREAIFVLEKPLDLDKATKLNIKLVQNHGGWNSDDNQNNNLGRFRFSITSDEPATANTIPTTLRQLLQKETLTPGDEDALFSHWRTTIKAWEATNQQIETLWKEHPAGSAQLILSQREMNRETRMLKRGDFLKPGEKVDAMVPAILNPLPKGAARDRLTFARWMVDRQSPTTARAFVNRLWQQLFGQGLVTSSEDLGTQAEVASHPELLDYLAVEFMDNGWSIKKLLKTIALSSTYRQTSKVSAELYAKDPYNRLLARGPRFRVDAETVRDIGLSISGLLNAQIGGRSVFPPLPEYMTKPPISYGPKTWPEDKDAQRYRRALYTFRYRSLPYPMLQTFDAPNGDTSCVRRPRSNTPLQALITLNDPLSMEAARAFAWKVMLLREKTDAERLTFAFKETLLRSPTDAETATLLKLLQTQKERNTQESEAWKIATNDPAQPPKLPSNMKPADAAAWTLVCRVLLNLDETITKE